MAKKERNQGSVGRARAKRGSDETSRVKRPKKMVAAPTRELMYEAPAGMPASVAPTVESTRPIPRPVRGGMESSPRPTPRPYTMEERGAVERGNRAAEREAQKFEDGGMVRGCGPAQMSGKGFRGEY